MEILIPVTMQFSRPDLTKEGFMDRMVSSAIMHETRSEICHVDIVIPNTGVIPGSGEMIAAASLAVSGTLIGAHARDGIRQRPADYENWGLRIRTRLQVDIEKARAFYLYAQSLIGTPYDKADILGIALGDSRIHVDGRMICSQFAALASDDKSGIVRVAKDKWQVSPEELRIAWMAAGAVEERL